jgi:hypothetical protein
MRKNRFAASSNCRDPVSVDHFRLQRNDGRTLVCRAMAR